MHLDRDTCLRAYRSRDARFDGRFFVGVRSTGIYCRPVCPARPPRAENVRFFPCAAAAEENGFRPCRRCHPEVAPGTPAWAGTSATVSRAMRLIGEGSLDDGGHVAGLAARLGVGERQLRRLFARHLGASPAAVARSRRAHFARRLLQDTDLPAGEVAHAAGYGSIRQFNAEIRRTFDASPTELRRRHPRDAPPADGMALRLALRPPFDWEALLAYLAPRAIPGVEVVAGGAYRRTVRCGAAGGWVEARLAAAGDHLVLRAHVPAGTDLLTLAERGRRLFDLDADPLPILRHLAEDPLLRRSVTSRPGMRVPGAWDPFETAVRAILGQVVSVARATALAEALVRAFGEPAPAAAPGLTHLFPSPATLACAPVESIGLTRARARAVRAFAAAVMEGRLRLGTPPALSEAVEALRSIPGIGPWTAGYIAMRSLGEPDALPSGDLGLRKAVGGTGRPASAAAVEEAAAGWRPWRSYGTVHVWSAMSAAPAGSPAGRGGG